MCFIVTFIPLRTGTPRGLSTLKLYTTTTKTYCTARLCPRNRVELCAELQVTSNDAVDGLLKSPINHPRLSVYLRALSYLTVRRLTAVQTPHVTLLSPSCFQRVLSHGSISNSHSHCYNAQAICRLRATSAPGLAPSRIRPPRESRHLRRPQPPLHGALLHPGAQPLHVRSQVLRLHTEVEVAANMEPLQGTRTRAGATGERYRRTVDVVLGLEVACDSI